MARLFPAGIGTYANPLDIAYSTDPASGRLEFYNPMLRSLRGAVRENTDPVP